MSADCQFCADLVEHEGPGALCFECNEEAGYDEPAAHSAAHPWSAPDDVMRRCLEDVKSLRLVAGVVWPDAAMHLDSAAVALRDALGVVEEGAAW